jgi:hypothetical protein
MIFRLNDGQEISDAPNVSNKTKKYLNKFWKIPDQKAIDKQKEKYYTHDFKRDWQSNKPKTKENQTDSIS